jgi:hypothetical protein
MGDLFNPIILREKGKEDVIRHIVDNEKYDLLKIKSIRGVTVKWLDECNERPFGGWLVVGRVPLEIKCKDVDRDKVIQFIYQEEQS